MRLGLDDLSLKTTGGLEVLQNHPMFRSALFSVREKARRTKPAEKQTPTGALLACMAAMSCGPIGMAAVWYCPVKTKLRQSGRMPVCLLW